MINFSDCYILKVKSFFGLKSIDPPVKFDVFFKNNFKDLKTLVEKNQLIGLDEQGNEIDNLLLKKYILDSYAKSFEKSNSDVIKPKNDSSDVYGIQEELNRLKDIDDEEHKKNVHKKRLLDSLEDCDEAYRSTLEKGLENNNQTLKTLKEERQSIVASINKKIWSARPQEAVRK